MTFVGGYYFIPALITYNAQFEYLLVPQVLFNGSKVNAFKGWYGKGSINFTAGTTFPNYWQQLNFRLVDVASTLQVPTQVAAKTQVQVVEWSRIQRDGFGTSGPSQLYFQLKYNATGVANFTRVEIYRRERNIQATDTYRNFYGIGRWEKITVTGSNSSTTSGLTTVNLRTPLNHSEFNAYYGAPSGATQTNTSLVVNSLFSTNKPLANPIAANFEYLIVTVTSTGNFLQLLPHIPYIALSNKVNGFNYGQPTNVAESAYNAYPEVNLRRLNQAINSITDLSTLRFGFNTVSALATVPSGEPAVI
jgi:hypothetical protein